MTNTDKTTPRPWQIDGYYIFGEYRKDVNGADYICHMESGIPERNKPNAELIVRAVNNFDTLLEACKLAKSYLQRVESSLEECQELEELCNSLDEAISNTTK